MRLEGLSAPVIVTRRPRHPDRERRLARRCGARDRPCTRRIDSSRWIWRGAGRPGNSAGWRAGDRGRQADPHASLSRRSPTGSRRDGPGMARDHRGLHVGGEQRFESTAQAALRICLRQEPHKWLVEDSMPRCAVHVHHAQDPDGSCEATLATMHDVLPEAMANFLAPIGTEWDSPIVGRARCPTDSQSRGVTCARPSGQPSRRLPAPRPPTRLLRPIEQEATNQTLGVGVGTWELEVGLRLSLRPPRPFDKLRVAPSRVEGRAASRGGAWELDKEGAIGSNNWAISGRLTADGRASSPTTCISPCASPTRGIAPLSNGRMGPTPRHIGLMGVTPRRSCRRRWQQHARGVGLHQLAGRLERHRPDRDRIYGLESIPHAGGLADLRAAPTR